jgi:restriction system protein
VIRNRTHGAMTDLTRAGPLASTRRGHFRITERGLAMKPASINSKFLRRYPEFVAFVGSSAGATRLDDHDEQAVNATGSVSNRTPEEVVVSAHAELGAILRIQLLDRVVHSDPAFFERLVVTLLLAMGFGGGLPDAGRAIGGSGDGGIDGVTDQDALGRDRVYIQAKRHRPENAIGPKEIQAFFGALNMAKAAKRVFITTSSFTRAAQETAEKQGSRIVLIDGNRLTQLMIRYDVGVRIEQAFHIKKIDEDFVLDE